MVILTLILALAFAIVAVIFALQNPTLVTVSFFGSSIEGSLALFILSAVILGVLIGVLVMVPGTVRHSLELRNNRKRIGDLEKSLEAQNIPPAKAGKIEPLTDFPEDDIVR
ncbi:MAG: LapA family protein [Chloroflexota bacterium]|nr:LapA family protein [Chloroflexota bacterium]